LCRCCKRRADAGPYPCVEIDVLNVGRCVVQEFASRKSYLQNPSLPHASYHSTFPFQVAADVPPIRGPSLAHCVRTSQRIRSEDGSGRLRASHRERRHPDAQSRKRGGDTRCRQNCIIFAPTLSSPLAERWRCAAAATRVTGRHGAKCTHPFAATLLRFPVRGGGGGRPPKRDGSLPSLPRQAAFRFSWFEPVVLASSHWRRVPGRAHLVRRRSRRTQPQEQHALAHRAVDFIRDILVGPQDGGEKPEGGQ